MSDEDQDIAAYKADVARDRFVKIAFAGALWVEASEVALGVIPPSFDPITAIVVASVVGLFLFAPIIWAFSSLDPHGSIKNTGLKMVIGAVVGAAVALFRHLPPALDGSGGLDLVVVVLVATSVLLILGLRFMRYGNSWE